VTPSGGTGRPGAGSGGTGGAGGPRGKRSWGTTAAIAVAIAVLLYVVISTLATGRFF